MKRTLAAALFALALNATPALAFDGWHLENSTQINGTGSAWDYLSLDASRQHLFIGHRKEGLQVFDLSAHKLLTTVAKTASESSNGATLMPEHDLGISNNENGTITPFKLSTLEAREPIKLGDELDSSHYDAATQRVLVNMAAGKDGTDLIVLEAPSLKQVGTVHVATKKPEHGEGDGKGNFFLASRDLDMVYRIDMRTLQVTAQWPTPGCSQTNGLALDAANKRIFIGCRGSDKVKPSFAVMDAETGLVVYTSEIGGGNDGVAFDADLKRVFLTNGVHAVLNVFEQVDANTYKPVESLGTRAGVRALVLDPKTKKIYSFGAEGSADAAKKITTSVSPFYANTFFPNSFVVLTYSK